MPYYADTSDVVRRGWKYSRDRFSDRGNCQEEQEASYDFISSVIGEYDESHPKINGIEKIEIKLAASFVMDHFNQYKDKANEELQEAYKLLEVLKGGLTGGAADITNLFSTTSYQSYSAAMSEDPTQTEVRPYLQ